MAALAISREMASIMKESNLKYESLAMLASAMAKWQWQQWQLKVMSAAGVAKALAKTVKPKISKPGSVNWRGNISNHLAATKA